MKRWIFIFPFLFLFNFVKADTVYYSGTKNEPVMVSRIVVFGNDKTKEYIILRELTFSKGDTINYYSIPRHLEKCKANLMNTSLFNFVKIDTATLLNEVEFIIMVQERWYVWPYPILEIADRNFNVWLKEKNWEKINYGINLYWQNISGRKDDFQAKAILGYAERYGLAYKVPYINKKKTIGIGVENEYKQNKEINYQTINDQPQYFKADKGYVRNEFTSKVNLYFRPGLYNRHILSLDYYYSSVMDTIAGLNPNFFGKNLSSIKYFSAKYQYSRDSRESKAYLLKGYMYKMTLEKTGLGLNDHINNANLRSAFVFSVPLSNKFSFGSGTIGKVDYNSVKTIFISDSQLKNPYFISKALGYNEIIAGYENYVINGTTYFISKNHLRYELIAPKEGHVGFIKNPKFGKYHYAMYLNANFDLGYVYNNENGTSNDLNNEMLYGGGLGIDFVTYYDIVIRLEYSVNKNLEHGFAIHYGSPFFSW